jgi:hypothetical protein
VVVGFAICIYSTLPSHNVPCANDHTKSSGSLQAMENGSEFRELDDKRKEPAWGLRRAGRLKRLEASRSVQ